jgi:hypothetical protein
LTNYKGERFEYDSCKVSTKLKTVLKKKFALKRTESIEYQDIVIREGFQYRLIEPERISHIQDI